MAGRISYILTAAALVLVAGCGQESPFVVLQPPHYDLRPVPESVSVARGDTVSVLLGISQLFPEWSIGGDLPAGVTVVGLDDEAYTGTPRWEPARTEDGELVIRVAVAPDAWRDTATISVNAYDGYARAAGRFFLTAASDAECKYPIAEFEVCSAPGAAVEAALSADGSRIYVLCFPGLLLAFDLTSRRVIDSVMVDAGADLALSPDGAFAYISHGDNDGGELQVVDLDSRILIDTVHVLEHSTWVNDVMTHPDGTHAYVASAAGITSDTGAVLVLDLGSNEWTDTIGVAAESGAFAPDGSFAFLVGSRTWIVDAGTRAIIDSIPGGLHTPVDIAVSPDGKLAVVRRARTGSSYRHALRLAQHRCSFPASFPDGHARSHVQADIR